MTAKKIIKELPIIESNIHIQQAPRHGVETFEMYGGKNIYKLLVENSLQGMLIYQDEKIIYANHAFAEMTGYSIEELLEHDDVINVLIDPNYQGFVREIANQLLLGKVVTPKIEYQIVKKNGQTCWVAIQAVLIDFYGKSAIQAVFVDITQRKQAEEALRKEANFIRNIFDTAQAIILVLDPEGRIVRFNRLLEEIAGYSLEDVLHKDWINTYIPKIYRKHIRKFILQALDERQMRGIVSPMVTKDGRELLIEWYGNTIMDENDHLVGLLAIGQEVTERQLGETKLRKSEEQYRILFETMTQGVIYVNSDGSIISCNPAAEEILGLSLDLLRDHNVMDPKWRLIHEDGSIIENESHPVMVAIKTKKEVSNQIIGIYNLKSNQYRWINIRAVPQFKNGDHRPYQVYATLEDITERKKAEEALQEAIQFNQEVIAGAGEGIIVYDRELRCQLWNPFMEQLTRIPAADILGKKPTEVFPHMREYNIDHFLQQALKGEIQDSPDSPYYIPKTGRSGWVSRTLTPRRDANGNIIGIISLLHDITWRRQAEEEIRDHARRAEALVHVAAHLNSRLELDVILKTVCEETSKALNKSIVCIDLYDEQSGGIVSAADYGFPPEIHQHTIPISLAIYEEFLSQCGGVGIIQDVRAFDDQPLMEMHANRGIRSMMWANMLNNGRLLGVLKVVIFDEIRVFTENELVLLNGLADQAAQAIVNARLFEQVSAGRRRLRALSRELVEVQESERRSIALELHDELGQMLNSVKMSLDMIPILPENGSMEHLHRAQALISDLINRVRRMALELRPSMLDDLGLLPALLWLFKNFQTQTNGNVTFTHEALEQRFPPLVEINAYRIIQEALTNVARHAGVNQVSVDIWADKESLYLQIVDQGVGFNPTNVLMKNLSTGLSGMRERARLSGGELVVESKPGTGTNLTARLPLWASVSQAQERRYYDDINPIGR